MWTREDAAAARGCARLAGVDEAGRGPLAGPVVAAAVAWPSDVWRDPAWRAQWRGLTDSKKLSPARREFFFARLTAAPGVQCAVAAVEAPEIDRINILRATHAAMRAALAQLQPPPDWALVDGLPVPDLPCPGEFIIGGDGTSLTIAAASVIAKVARDRRLTELDRQYPGYGFAAHKGYGTRAHLDAIRRLGLTPEHRRSFAPCAAAEQSRTGLR